MNITISVSTTDFKSSTTHALTKEQATVVLKAARSYRGPSVFLMDRLLTTGLGLEKPKRVRERKKAGGKRSKPAVEPVLPETDDPSEQLPR